VVTASISIGPALQGIPIVAFEAVIIVQETSCFEKLLCTRENRLNALRVTVKPVECPSLSGTCLTHNTIPISIVVATYMQKLSLCPKAPLICKQRVPYMEGSIRQGLSAPAPALALCLSLPTSHNTNVPNILPAELPALMLALLPALLPAKPPALPPALMPALSCHLYYHLY